MFQPKLLGAAADVGRAYPAAASVDVSADVGHMPLPYIDVDVCWPGSATGPRQPESATSVDIAGQPSVGTPMHASMMRGPALPTVVDVPRPRGLVPSVDDVARTSVVDVGVARPAYGLALPYVAEVARLPGPSSVDVVGPAYESKLSTAPEGVHPYAPPSVDAPRPSSVGVCHGHVQL